MPQARTRTGWKAHSRSPSDKLNDTLTIGIRFALYANLMLLLGLPLFGLYALRGAERLHSNVLPLRLLASALAAVGIALSILSIAAMTASMAGVPLFEVDYASIKMMIAETPMGMAWQARIVGLFAALLFAAALGARKSPVWLILVSLGSAVALASLAWTGHGAASEGTAGTRHLIADIVHLLSAGAWIGALAGLGLLLFRRSRLSAVDHIRLTHRALEGFSVIGTVLVALVVVSGLANSWMLVGVQHMLSMGSTLYGQLLIAKLGLFGAMLALAAANRFRLTPALERAVQSGDTVSAQRHLRGSLITESGAAFVILGLVAWLGTLQPPMAM